jgi:hypothetical protein
MSFSVNERAPIARSTTVPSGCGPAYTGTQITVRTELDCSTSCGT